MLCVHCLRSQESTPFLFKERPTGHFWLIDLPQLMELLFTKLNTAAKIMFSKGILMLFLTLFVFVFFVIPSKLTAGKERLWMSSFAQSQLRIRDHPRRARQRGVVMQ